MNFRPIIIVTYETQAFLDRKGLVHCSFDCCCAASSCCYLLASLRILLFSSFSSSCLFAFSFTLLDYCIGTYCHHVTVMTVAIIQHFILSY
jgi:hypothetical protein